MTTETAFDQAQSEAFVHQVLGDTSGLFVTIMAAIGARGRADATAYTFTHGLTQPPAS